MSHAPLRVQGCCERYPMKVGYATVLLANKAAEKLTMSGTMARSTYCTSCNQWHVLHAEVKK